MSKKLENKFKEQLESYEASYNEGAWESFEKRLDQSAVSSSGISKASKLAVAFGVIAVASFGVFFYSVSSDTTQSKYAKSKNGLNEKSEIKNSEDTQDDFVVKENTDKKETSAQNNDPIKEESSTKNVDNQLNSVENINDKHLSKDEFESDNNEEVDNSEINKEEESTEVNKSEAEENIDKPVKRRFVSGVVPNLELCVGDYITVKNPDEAAFVRFKYGNTDLTIPPKQHSKLKVTVSDKLIFLNDNDEVLDELSIISHDLPSVDFKTEANVFDQGLPVTELEAFGTYKKYDWYINGQKRSEGQKAQVNIFEKGDFDIQLRVIDENGCEGNRSRNIRIEKDYNLMAPNAISPQSNDRRKNTFIPYALLERDLDFEFVVVDPKTHRVIFKSNDKNNPWDGRNQRTGEMTEKEKVYVWKVHIKNPNPGEEAIYTGTVMHN